MTYSHAIALRNMIVATGMSIIAFCLHWSGVLSISASTLDKFRGLGAINYDLTAIEGIFESALYSTQVAWMSYLRSAYLLWASMSTLALFLTWKYVSRQAAGLLSLALLVATFVVPVPLLLTNAYHEAFHGQSLWAMASVTPDDGYTALKPLAVGEVKIMETARVEMAFQWPFSSSRQTSPVYFIGFNLICSLAIFLSACVYLAVLLSRQRCKRFDFGPSKP